MIQELKIQFAREHKMSCCNNPLHKEKPSFHPAQVKQFQTPVVGGVSPVLQTNPTETNDKVIQVTDRPIPAKPIVNMAKAAISQENKVSWFLDGITGLKKCVTNDVDYSKEQIEANRQACKDCPHSTKKDGKITTFSQCMAPDPAKNNQPCGCFVLCKTQVGKCPLDRWTSLTINQT